MDTLTIAAKGISVSIDLIVGHIADFVVEAGGRKLRPLHRAPWINEPDVPPTLPPGQARLSGDYLCAPFSRSDIEEAPVHGWPANSRWSVTASAATPDGWQAELRLDRKVMGATVEKILVLRDDHPFLYQEHRFIGGRGELPAAHHVMGAMANGGRISFSPKRFAETPDTALENDPARGRSMLAYPARSEDLAHFPTSGGGFTNLEVYGPDDRRDDLVVLVEGVHPGPGWTALARQAERDLLIVLKDPRDLPVTLLWYSNGGRNYAPWNGRHLGVLGIEDGRTAIGHSASLGDNFLRRAGVATSFHLSKKVSFRHVIGALALNGAEPPASVEIAGDELQLEFADGTELSARYDASFLKSRNEQK